MVSSSLYNHTPMQFTQIYYLAKNPHLWNKQFVKPIAFTLDWYTKINSARFINEVLWLKYYITHMRPMDTSYMTLSIFTIKMQQFNRCHPDYNTDFIKKQNLL